mgnify:CR=1 FL=1|tara:strand:+ start:1191 stop:2150 length:960 start_codon:yes stop_codon:yes gene_type:complete
MSYIGKSPSIGSYSMLDNLTASATASYSLTLDSVAFVPESANHLIVSLNGVIQKAGSSFTVSGSTLTFSSTLASSDSIDFILALGNVLDIGTPSDATVTNAKTNFVSTSSAAGLQIKGDGTTDGTLQLNCSQNSHGIKLKSPAHSASASYTLTFPTTDGNADEFLQTNGSGVLTWASAGGANTPAFHITSSGDQVLTTGTATTIAFATEVVDTDSAFASNTFTVPSGKAGKYFVYAQVRWNSNSDFEGIRLTIRKNSTNMLSTWGRNEYYQNQYVAGILDLAASDTVDVQGRHTRGSDCAIGATDSGPITFFGGYKLIT